MTRFSTHWSLWGGLIGSPSVAALVLFLILNIVYPRSSNFRVAEAQPDMMALLRLKPCRLIVGSSVIALPLYLMYAERTHRAGTGFVRFSAAHPLWQPVLPESFSAAHDGLPTLSAAGPGQMVPDTNLVLDRYIDGANQHHQVWLFLGPRDVCDMWEMAGNHLSSPPNSQKDLWLVRKIEHAVQWRISYLLSRWMGLWTERSIIQHNLYRSTCESYKSCGLFQSQIVRDSWRESLLEYARHYANMRVTDSRFMNLVLLSNDCRRLGVALTVVNVPLAADNRDLMPPGFYKQFRDKLAALSKSCRFKLIDLGESKAFDNRDFDDSAHLSASGGRKMLEMVLTAQYTSEEK